MVNLMRRLTVYACRGDTDAILERLMWLESVEISEQFPEKDAGDEGSPLYAEHCSFDEQRTECEALNARIDATLEALRKMVRKKEKGKGNEPESRDDFAASGRAERAEETVAKVTKILSRRDALQSSLDKCITQETSLLPWKSLDTPPEELGSKSTVSFLGTVSAAFSYDTMHTELEETGAYTELVSSDASASYILVLCRKAEEEEVSRILLGYGFLKTAIPFGNKTPENAANELGDEREKLETQIADIENELRELLPAVPDIERLSDVTKTRLTVIRAKGRLYEGGSTVKLCGWIPECRQNEVTEVLDGFPCAYEIAEPEEDDDVPIQLDNPKLAKPFETVLELYSLPKYPTFDPTKIMAIFYFIIFGMMFADVGYGLLLTVGCLILLKVMKPKKGGALESLMKLFAICGISCAVFGVVFGAYFGDLPGAIATSLLGKSEAPAIALWFDPLKEPMTFLIASLAIGAVHMLAGMACQFVNLCKAGQVFAAIFDVGSWFVLFAGMGLYFVIGMPGAIVAGVGLLMLILTQGRAEKNPIMKFLKGLLSLYNIVNYAADLLSYSRILALGLAATVIAQVVNMLGTMGGPSGMVAGTIILIGGHALNLVINLLGTFVHTSRLQYIEFFGKFYEDGGRPFEPLTPVADYIGR